MTPTHAHFLMNFDWTSFYNHFFKNDDNLLSTPNMTNDFFLNFFGLPQFWDHCSFSINNLSISFVWLANLLMKVHFWWLINHFESTLQTIIWQVWTLDISILAILVQKSEICFTFVIDPKSVSDIGSKLGRWFRFWIDFRPGR